MRFASTATAAGAPAGRRALAFGGVALVVCLLWTAWFVFVGPELPEREAASPFVPQVSIALAPREEPTPTPVDASPAEEPSGTASPKEEDASVDQTTAPEKREQVTVAPIDSSKDSARTAAPPTSTQSPRPPSSTRPLDLRVPTVSSSKGLRINPGSPFALDQERWAGPPPSREPDPDEPYETIYGDIERKTSENCVIRELRYPIPVGNEDLIVYSPWCKSERDWEMAKDFRSMQEQREERRRKREREDLLAPK